MKLDVVRTDGTRLPPHVRPILETLAARLTPAWMRVDLVLAGDSTLRRLNRTYRHKDRTTDVLSFLYETSNVPTGGVAHAEIYVSLAQAKRQARERRHTLTRELVLLMLHGLLHLQGHDHEKAADARRMRRAEQPHLRWLHQKWQWPVLEPLVPASGTADARRRAR